MHGLAAVPERRPPSSDGEARGARRRGQHERRHQAGVRVRARRRGEHRVGLPRAHAARGEDPALGRGLRQRARAHRRPARRLRGRHGLLPRPAAGAGRRPVLHGVRPRAWAGVASLGGVRVAGDGRRDGPEGLHAAAREGVAQPELPRPRRTPVPGRASSSRCPCGRPARTPRRRRQTSSQPSSSRP